jgi:hypothetical protein
MIFMGIALWHGEVALRRVARAARYAYLTALALLAAFLFLQSYVLFVDHGREYPVETKKFLVWTLSGPDSTYKVAAFGFPYYRHWAKVAKYIAEDARRPFYWSNEKAEITGHYLPQSRSAEQAGYYVYVTGRQDWYGPKEEARYRNWRASNPPVLSFEDDGAVRTSVYFLPERTPP